MLVFQFNYVKKNSNQHTRKLKLISQIVRAMDHTWHPDHFCCSECKKPITEPKFSERDEKPVCSKCFNEKFAEICFHCNEPITEVMKVIDLCLLFRTF
jgi:hypothetical protein